MNNQLIEKIIQNPLFLRLKDVVENNSYHDHEDVYSHSIKTKDWAIKEITGDFITNTQAKQSFLQFVNEEIDGMKRVDIMVLIALLHDIGKILSVRDEDKTHSLLVTNVFGMTVCPGHEYWGSTIVDQLLQNLDLSEKITHYIATVIKLHDTFNADYFEDRATWPADFLINDVKSRAEGLYKEALFNIYCDCFTVDPFQAAKKMVIKIFNDPKLYGKREYTIT